MRRVMKQILRETWHPPTCPEQAIQTVFKQAEALASETMSRERGRAMGGAECRRRCHSVRKIRTFGTAHRSVPFVPSPILLTLVAHLFPTGWLSGGIRF